MFMMMTIMTMIMLTGDQSHADTEPASSTAGRFQLRPSSLEKHAASLFKGSFIILC